MKRKNIHIGFGDSANGCLLEAMQKHGLPGKVAIPLRDDFTQGPISESFKPHGIFQRIEYWDSLHEGIGRPNEGKALHLNSIQQLKEIESAKVTLWVGKSCHDVMATGWLIEFLKEKDIEWYMVDLGKVNKKDLPYGGLPPVNLGMYTPIRLPVLWQYRKKMTSSQLKKFRKKFNIVRKENKPYRILKKNKILSVGEKYYDSYLLSFFSKRYIKMKDVIGRMIRDKKYRISTIVIERNVKRMIDSNKLQYKGDLASFEDCLVRISKKKR